VIVPADKEADNTKEAATTNKLIFDLSIFFSPFKSRFSKPFNTNGKKTKKNHQPKKK
jgi:hypothetical protein